jgi:acyl-CoA thioesterase FadM
VLISHSPMLVAQGVPCRLCLRLRSRQTSLVSHAASHSTAALHTLQQRCYIEHTDCFQVVFYARYFGWMAAGREAATGGRRLVLLAADSGRLASPAVLGDTVEVRSEVVATDSSRRLLVWKQQVAPLHSAVAGAKPHASCHIVSGVVDDAHGQLQTLPPSLVDGIAVDEQLLMPALVPSQVPTAVVTEVTLYSIELSGNLETDVLRWFERNRTDIIGGGAGLKALQRAHTLVVVTAVNGFKIDRRAAAAHMKPQRVVHIKSGIVTKRRGLFIVFHQECWADGHLIAQAEITCACVDANTMGLSSDAPPALLDLLTAAEGKADHTI